ncbi:transmembrane protein 238 [Etheostoma spectabile]|uniref:transmembrane protein 238 n=1 Tax=Etheostoma spectabile TaxID=54343 RepID=UPI0013AF1BCE|nr:transmembrane protein 238-like [Etheostoma spectabile]
MGTPILWLSRFQEKKKKVTGGQVARWSFQPLLQRAPRPSRLGPEQAEPPTDSPYSRSETQCQGTEAPASGELRRPPRRSGVIRADMEAPYRGLGRCVGCFWLAVAFDIVGLLVLLLGVFVNVFFYDLLIYAGAIVIFLSLIWWVFWYSGNIEVPPAELEDDVGLLKKNKGALGGIGGAVRRLSSRVSSGIRSSLRRNGGAPGTRAAPTQMSARGPSVVAPRAEQVAVAMATMTPQEDIPHTAVSSVAGSDVDMPKTTTETSPA